MLPGHLNAIDALQCTAPKASSAARKWICCLFCFTSKVEIPRENDSTVWRCTPMALLLTEFHSGDWCEKCIQKQVLGEHESAATHGKQDRQECLHISEFGLNFLNDFQSERGIVSHPK